MVQSSGSMPQQLSPGTKVSSPSSHSHSTPGELKLKIYSWNTGGLAIPALTSAQLKQEKEREGGPTNSTATLLLQIGLELQNENPAVVAFLTQRSRKPGDYFHSHAIPSLFEVMNLKYKKLRRTKQIGTGGTGKVLKNLRQSKALGYGLRTSIYVLSEYHQSITEHENALKSSGWEDRGYYSCGAGLSLTRDALASYLAVPGFPVVALLNCFISSDKSTLKSVYLTNDYNKRAEELKKHNECYKAMLQALAGGTYENPVGYVIVAGDLGYRIIPPRIGRRSMSERIEEEYKTTVPFPGSGTSKLQQSLQQLSKDLSVKDELRIETSKPGMIALQEGVKVVSPGMVLTGQVYKVEDSEDKSKMKEVKGLGIGATERTEGSSFLPTCPLMLKRTQSVSEWNGTNPSVLKLYNEKGEDVYYPSWCNRILYGTSSEYTGGITCTQYKPLDTGIVRESSQSSISASFKLSSMNQEERRKKGTSGSELFLSPAQTLRK